MIYVLILEYVTMNPPTTTGTRFAWQQYCDVHLALAGAPGNGEG